MVSVRDSTDEVAVLYRLYPGVLHGLPVHRRARLRHELLSSIVTVRDALEQVVHSKNLHHSLAVGDVRVGQEPELDLAAINVLQEFSETGIWRQNLLKRDGVVDFFVEVQRVHLMMLHEALD